MKLEPMLTDAQRAIVREIVHRVVPGVEFWMVGSRATGHARPFSDLDLLVTRPERLGWEQRAALQDAFEASELPFCVDVVEAAALAPAVARRMGQERAPV